MDSQKIAQLEKFVHIIQANPDLIHLPELDFFKQFLLDMGAHIAPRTNEPKDMEDGGRMEAETQEVSVPKPVSNDEEKVGQLKSEAAELVESGNSDRAIDLLGSVISLGGGTAMVLTRRADLLLKLRKPLSAISHCDAALVLNPDSGKAFRVRGLAHRALQEWEKAHADLAVAQTIDFDDQVEEVKKLVDKKWTEQKSKIPPPKVVEEDVEEVGHMGGMGGMGGMPGMPNMGGMPGMGMPDMGSLFSDPELMAAMSNPKIMTALTSMMSNPASFLEYQNDPEVGPVLAKLMSKMGGAM